MNKLILKEKIGLLLKQYGVFFIFLFLNLLFYGSFVIRHYAPDTYFTEATGWKSTALIYFASGRWLMSLLSLFCGFFHINVIYEQFLSWIIAIISISLSSYVVYNLLKNKIVLEKNYIKKGWLILISFMLISNVFLLEYFIFAEYTGIMCLGVFLNVLGAKYIIKFIEQKNFKFYVLGIVFAILGINGHQGNFAVFLLVCVLCLPNMFDTVKNFIQKNFIIGSAYLIPSLVNMWEVHIGNSSRFSGSNINFAASFIKSTEGIRVLLKTTANFMPYYVYVISIVILGGYFGFHIFQKKKWKMLLNSLYWLVIMFLGIYAPLMMTKINQINVVPRTVYILGSIIPIMLLGLVYMDVTPKNSFFLPMFVLCIFAVQYWGIARVSTSHYQSNAVDRYEAQYIGNFLREYEREHGVKVTKLALYWDDNVNGWATGVLAGYGAVNERIMTNDWAAPLAIKCLDGYDIQMTEKSEEVYKLYFEGKDWTLMNKEQFIVIGDTLHLCAY
ncbi:MAG: glucosyltransferase domain-containing protein [Muricomes sp.]